MSALALRARLVMNPRMSWSSAGVSPTGMVVVVDSDSEDIMGQDSGDGKRNLHEGACRAGGNPLQRTSLRYDRDA